MACPGEGPCAPWDLDLSCCLVTGRLPDPCLGDGTPIDQSIIDTAVLAASQFLWRRTGMQFGCCTVTINPCMDCSETCAGLDSGTYDGFWGFPWYPLHLANGDWTNVKCPCTDACVCGRCELRLPYSVCSVDEVVINGNIIPPEAYRVDDFSKIVLLDNGPAVSGTADCWKGCDNSITLTYGRPVPELVRLAAAEFACQLIKRCVGKPCDLPQRVQSISRQGVSATFLDPMEFMGQGFTGIFLVDLAIKTYNPKGLYKKAAVYSPDSIGKWRVTTWKPGDDIGPGCT